jgi:excisionase family DNA binding protein
MAVKLLSVAEVAELWGTSVDYVYDRIAAKELPVINLGRGRAKTRIRETAADAFIDRNDSALPKRRLRSIEDVA